MTDTRKRRHAIEKYTFPQVGVVLVRPIVDDVPGEWELKELPV